MRRGRPTRRGAALAAAALLALVPAACGRDDGATVRNLDPSPTGGAAGGSGSASAPAGGGGSPLGGYVPASDVAALSRIALDVCEIGTLLGASPVDYRAVRTIYAEGKNSARADGRLRSLRGFAMNPLEEPTWQMYAAHFGDDVWLEAYVAAAIGGEGSFAGAPDAVRRQGIQKGVQNQVLMAWVFHELDGAIASARAGDFDAADGAAHKIDEAWALYHGADPACAPYGTADRRDADFGKEPSVNPALLAVVRRALEAAVGEDAAALEQAVAEVAPLVTVTYVQAALKYSAQIDAALAEGDAERARVSQAEGGAFFRAIAPFVARADPAAARAVAAVFDLDAPPAPGSGGRVRAALEPAYPKLGISADQVGRQP